MTFRLAGRYARRRWYRLRMLRRSEEDTTEYLLNSPKNAARLREALEQSRRGEGIPFTMDDLRSELERGAHV